MNVSMIRAACTLVLFGLLALPASANDPLSTTALARSNETAIIVGSADFPESQLLATIYAKALSAKGFAVETKSNVGSREVYMPALLDGSIDLLPEYAGAALRYLDKSSTANSSRDVGAALAKVLPEGITMLKASDAQDATTVTVTRATAARYELKGIGDLRPHAPDLVLGGPPEWKVRPEGVPGLKAIYGLEFKSYRVLDVCGPLTLSALLNSQIDVGCMNSTDPAIEEHDLVSLNDPESLIPTQNVVPFIASSKNSGDVAAVLDAVSSALTTDDLIVMNGRLARHESFDTVAADWLELHHLN